MHRKCSIRGMNEERPPEIRRAFLEKAFVPVA